MSANTVPQTIAADQANKEVPILEDLSALAHMGVYGYRADGSSGLTFCYHGGRWGGFSIASSTVSLSASTTNYIVVNRSTGAVSVSTSTTNWNDSTGYARVYRVTTDGSGVTNLFGSDFDYRGGPGGVHGTGAAAGAGTELRGLTFTSDTSSQTDGDPGNGLFRWNNATQASATKLFIDNQTADGVSLSTFWSSLASAGTIFIQQANDANRWQLWRWTAVTDDTGYRDFTVTLQAKSTSDIQNSSSCYLDIKEAVTSGNPVEHIIIACSDETSALTTGAAKVTFRMPYAFTLTGIRASVTTAPTGSTLIVDVNEAGSTIMTTNKLSIDASERTSTTAATAAGLTDTSLADDAEMTIDIDQVGSTVAGAGLKVTLIGYRT